MRLRRSLETARLLELCLLGLQFESWVLSLSLSSQIRPSHILPAPDLGPLFLDICLGQCALRSLGGASAPVSASTVLPTALCESSAFLARGLHKERVTGAAVFAEGGLANMQRQDRPRVPSCVGGQALESARGGQLPASEEGGS